MLARHFRNSSTTALVDASTSVSGIRQPRSGAVDMRVKLLDRKRRNRDWTHSEFCARAGVTERLWQYLRNGEPLTDATLKKFEAALAGHDARKGQTPGAVRALHRAITTLLCVYAGEDPQPMLAQDFSAERAADAQWARAAHYRGLATYICAVEIEIDNETIGAAIGATRQAVHRRRRTIEDLREEDPRTDHLIKVVTAYARGET